MGDVFAEIFSNHEGSEQDNLLEHYKKTCAELIDIIENFTGDVSRLSDIRPEKYKNFTTSEEKTGTIQSIDFCKNDKLWAKYFPHILKGAWTLKKQPQSFDAYALSILGFYIRSIKNHPTSINKMLPTLLIIEQKVRELHGYQALYVAKTVNIEEKWETADKKRLSRKSSKINEDWAPLIRLIEEMEDRGCFPECNSVQDMAEEVKSELKSLRKKDKTVELFAVDTIKRCFNEVFELKNIFIATTEEIKRRGGFSECESPSEMARVVKSDLEKLKEKNKKILRLSSEAIKYLFRHHYNLTQKNFTQQPTLLSKL